MRFGGHETFAIREGWLHKGLKLLIERPDLLVDEYAADWLGVGRNMAKSIHHWLVATGLAERTMQKSGRRVASMKPTALAEIVQAADPYFLDIGTWWILHVNMVNRPDHAATWCWFFNQANLTRFEKPLCIEGMRRQIEISRMRPPSDRTLDRDVSCLLSTYARRIPPEDSDPEDAKNCPFRELGLMTHYVGSGYYELHYRPKHLPAELIGYALARSSNDTQGSSKHTDISIQDAAMKAGGPGRAFVMTAESLFEVVSSLDSDAALQRSGIELAGHAGERVIRIVSRDPLDWVRFYYKSANAEITVDAA